MFFPLLASIAKAGGVVVDKYLLSVRNMAIPRFVVWLFLFLALFTFPVVLFNGSLSLQAFTREPVILFGLMIALAFSWNILYYRSIKSDSVQEFEPILMLSPLVVILISPLFFPGEVGQMVYYLAIIAGVSLFISHLEEHHLRFSANLIGLLVAIVLMSVEVIIIKELLVYYSPAVLYFSRCFFLLIFYLIYFRKRLIAKQSRSYLPVASTALLGTIQMLASFYGYSRAGVVFTTLVLIIAPILVYFYCYFVLKEPLKPKKLVGGIIIITCVISAYLLG